MKRKKGFSYWFIFFGFHFGLEGILEGWVLDYERLLVV
jgi:hypothetical protein